MELSDSFEVDHPIATVWGVFTDVERIAPCLPGAQLTGTEGDEFHGVVKVKVGPVTSQYKGKASFAEMDEASHRAVISASGRDTRGAGNASAEITVQLGPGEGASTMVNVHTNLIVTGKVAQFGRGVLVDVSRKLMAQFADNLAALMATEQPDEAAAGNADASDEAAAGDADASDDSENVAPSSAVEGAERAAPAPEVEAVDLLAVAGGSVMKRLVPVAVALVIVVIVVIVAVTA